MARPNQQERLNDTPEQQSTNQNHFGVEVIKAIEFAEALLSKVDIANGYQVYDQN